ncbi:hypothetical protein ACWCXH_31800 [Kitasatospora sp. NPDC001660]
MILAGSLAGDTAVRFDVPYWAEEIGRTEGHLLAEIDWLVKHRFLALDGAVDNVMRLWVNPAVGCRGGTDPRIAAARHRFPFTALHDKGMAAAEPVRIVEYSEELWEGIYQANCGIWACTTMPSPDCAVHRPRATLRPV